MPLLGLLEGIPHTADTLFANNDRHATHTQRLPLSLLKAHALREETQ